MSEFPSGTRTQWRNKAWAMGACFLGRHFDILFDTMTQIAHNDGKSREKVGENIKMS